jgi:hypothetical protein
MKSERCETQLNNLLARLKEVESPSEKLRIMEKALELQGKLIDMLIDVANGNGEVALPVQDESRD